MPPRERLIQLGEALGFQLGIQLGERGLLLRQLRKRFGTQIDAAVERRLAVASAEQIATWADRVLSAATLDQVLAD